MAAVISYDVSSRHVEVKALMLQQGYFDSWIAEGVRYNLPNTTLYNGNAEPAQALAAIKSVTQQLGVTLQRAMALTMTTWDGIPGWPHS